MEIAITWISMKIPYYFPYHSKGFEKIFQFVDKTARILRVYPITSYANLIGRLLYRWRGNSHDSQALAFKSFTTSGIQKTLLRAD